jgi:outer membrane usher protein
VNANFNYSYRHDERGAEHRGLFSISIPLGPRKSARASYDTRRNRVSADFQMLGFEGLDQTDVRLGAVRADNGEAFNVDIEHYSNRFRAAIRHNYDRFDGMTQQSTDLAASFGIGFTDGKVAIGRDAARGFAIVDRHKTLRDAEVVVSDSFSIGPTAKTGVLGPALVPVRRAYQPSTLNIDIADLPIGYDIGPGRYDILPGAASGYAITIGSAASNTVLGRLIDDAGNPMAYATGMLEPLAGSEAKAVQFFTNRTGRMAVLKVAPGRYRVILSGQTTSIGEITVPDEAEGLVDVGELRGGVSR